MLGALCKPSSDVSSNRLVNSSMHGMVGKGWKHMEKELSIRSTNYIMAQSLRKKPLATSNTCTSMQTRSMFFFSYVFFISVSMYTPPKLQMSVPHEAIFKTTHVRQPVRPNRSIPNSNQGKRRVDQKNLDRIQLS